MAPGSVDEAARLIAAQRTYYDLRAPDHADVSRPSDRRNRGLMGSDQVGRLVREFHVTGDVLELASGSGGFTRELTHYASSLTALDGSPKMLELNQEVVGQESVEYICADLFQWTPTRRFDFVFFGFWLSHVPPSHFESFWSTVRACLRSGGRVGFVDEDERARTNETTILNGAVPAARRTLSDGRVFDVVKVFWHPNDLERRLRAMGGTRTSALATLSCTARRHPSPPAAPHNAGSWAGGDSARPGLRPTSKSLAWSMCGPQSEGMSVEQGPSSVEEPWTHYWGDWVLEHGLPDPPETLDEGETVPVAYWRGERWAAVLELTYRPADPDPAFEPAGLDTDVQAYRWSGRDWEAAASSGGGRWSDGVRVRGPELAPGQVTRLGHGWHGGREWVAGEANGVAGRDARWVEVEQEGRVESQPIDSRLGAWVVAFDGRKPAIVRVRSERAVLLEDVVDAVDW